MSTLYEVKITFSVEDLPEDCSGDDVLVPVLDTVAEEAGGFLEIAAETALDRAKVALRKMNRGGIAELLKVEVDG